MSTYSRKSGKSRRSVQSWKSNHTAKSAHTQRTRNIIGSKLLDDIKSKHGVANTRSWHIEQSVLDHIQKPNPFNRLIGSHGNFTPAQQSSICSTLITCIEMIVTKKGGEIILKDSGIGKKDDDEKNDGMDSGMSTVDDDIKATPTEMFGVFMTLMEQKQSTEQEVSIMVLLSHLIVALPTNVMLLQFDHLSRKIGECFNGNIENTLCIEYSLQCMSSMLMVRISSGDTHSLWDNPFCQKMLQGLFVFAADDNNKLRKASLKFIGKIFGKYPKDGVPQNMKKLMRHFMENQIESVVDEEKAAAKAASDDDDDAKKKSVDLNVIAFLCELAMETMEYLTLRESAECISLLFNAVSFSMHSIGDNSFRFKNLNLQQMFLKLIYKFIKSLPYKFKMKPSQKKKTIQQSQSESKINELADELKDKVDLRKLVSSMNLDDVDGDDDENEEEKQRKYTKFVTQIFELVQKLKPQSSDSVGIPLYYNCLVAVISALYDFDKKDALKRSVSIVSLLLDGFDSNKKKIIEKAQASICSVLGIIVDLDLVRETKEKTGSGHGDNELPPLFEHTPALSPSDNKTRSKLPVLSRIMAMIEQLLDFKYRSCWLYVFDLCSDLFALFRKNGFFLLSNILTELAELRCLQAPPFKSNLEGAIGSAIRHCGPENVLSIISLNMPTADVLQLITMDKAILKANLWLLPLLKSNVNRTSLSFFGQKLLPIADMMMKQSEAAKTRGMIVHSKQFDSMAHAIWRIFPSFCIYPSDFTETFPKIAEPVAYYLMTLRSVRPYIIAGFIHLMKKPLNFIRRQNERGRFGGKMVERSKAQIATLRPLTANYLPILCNILVETDHAKRYSILKAIGYFSEIADKEYLEAHFKKTMVKWLQDDTELLLLRKQLMDDMAADNGGEERGKEEEKERREKLAEIKEKYEKLLNQETAYLLILREMVEFVDLNDIEQFWQFLKQQFMKKDQSPLIQKLLYRSLLAVLEYKDCVLMQDRKQLIHFTKFLLSVHGGGSSRALSIGARFARLKCVHTLLDCLAEFEVENDEYFVDEMDDDDDDDGDGDGDGDESVKDTQLMAMQKDENSFINISAEFIAELISNAALANLKNKKSALQIMALIAMRIGDVSSDLLNKFVLKLMASLLSTTHEMQSATILCLTYLMVELELRIPAETLGELLKTISLRIEDPTRGVIKASLDFMQIVVVEMPDGILEPNLMDVLTTLLRWFSDEKANRFRAKINKCIDLLLRRFGYERISQMVPNRFQRLINYLRKRANYMDNKKEQKKQQLRDEKSKNKLFGRKLEDLPPDHPFNISAAKRALDDALSDDDDGKLTVFEQLKAEKLSSKSGRTRGSAGDAMTDATSVRMRIDGHRNITDLSSAHSVKKHLVSEHEANKMLRREQRMSELGMNHKEQNRKRKGKNKRDGRRSRKKNPDHIYQGEDGRMVITDSESEDERFDRVRKNAKKWKNLSDEDEADSGSDLSDDAIDYNDDREVDDVLSQYSGFNKTTQLKKALEDISGRMSARSSNKRMSEQNRLEVVAKRRKILNAANNDAWLPGQLQPFGYHVMSPALLSRKKRHLRKDTFKQVMGGKKRLLSVRTDNAASNYISVSSTRKMSHGRYTLARGKVKAKQKHLMADIQKKHRENEMRRKSRKKGKKRSRSKRGTKRKLFEI